MNQRIPEYLRLHVEPARIDCPDEPKDVGPAVELLATLSRLSGWQFQLSTPTAGRRPASLAWAAEIADDRGATPQRLELHRRSADGPNAADRLDLEQATELAKSAAALLDDFYRTQRALWEREAELASGVPVLSRNDESEHLAERLEAILRGGGGAVGCDAAALYLLDDATTHLKLRATWGLDLLRLADPPRPLDQAFADLEALLGHVVVLDHRAPISGWRCPEPFASAVCVPVSTPSIPLGTMWVYSYASRDFTDHETNLVEMAAGRLAAELEREMLLCHGQQHTQAQRLISEINEWQRLQQPQVAPLLENWDLGGAATQNDTPSPSFFDWMLVDDERLALSVGRADGSDAQAAMTAAELRGAVRASMSIDPSPSRVLDHVNRQIWTSGVGDRQASLFCGVVDLAASKMQFAIAGNVDALREHSSRRRVLSSEDSPIGQSPDSQYHLRRTTLPPGAMLVIQTRKSRQAGAKIPLLPRRRGDQSPLTEIPAKRVAEEVLELSSASSSTSPSDVAAVVLRHAANQSS